MRLYVQGACVLAVGLVAFGLSCRRNQPSLVDTNQAPDTQLWYAPADSTDYEYLVHLYWRGVDRDGTCQRFIWVKKDTVATDESSWNPSARIDDYREGRITTRTDSIFAFTAYKNVAGIGVRKNRQAFYVAAIDDNGVIDPTPAAVEFVAIIGKLPEMRFVVYPDGVTPRPYRNLTPPADTVGMFKPFAISYHGTTTNGRLRGYQYFALNPDVTLPGQNVWNEDLADTLRSFPNSGTQELPDGVLKFAAKCIDDANAESQVDGGRLTVGVAQVVVNFDPDTWLEWIQNTYVKSSTSTTVPVNFADGIPDTVPFKSWVRFRYYSKDDRRDTWRCNFVANRDSCIDFQIKYRTVSVAGNTEDSGWLPRNGRHDSDAGSTADSNSVNIGSLNYEWFVRGIDENGTPDGTPPSFQLVGNFRPILNTASMVDHFGNALNLAVLDTLEWDFYKPIGWPNADSSGAGTGFTYQKRFSWTIQARGRDHPKDPDGSSIQSWRYYVYTDYQPGAGDNPGTGTRYGLGAAGDSWFPSSSTSSMSDRFEFVARYNDPNGDDLFASLPTRFPWVNQVITIELYGRDTPHAGGGTFEQVVYWNAVPPGQPAGPASSRNTINFSNVAPSGRWTPKKVWTFYCKLKR